MDAFARTREALVTFDAGAALRYAAWDTVATADDVINAEIEDRYALRQVQDAFYLDTKAINSKESCRRVDIEFMRRMAERQAA